MINAMGEVLRITGTGAQLEGVGRLADGRCAFVPFALPGEEVEIAIEKDAGRFVRARLLRVLSPSPQRVVADCPYYGQCGGCQARHMRYAYSLELKRQKVIDALERIGGFAAPKVLPAIGLEDPLRQRNKAEYPIVSGKIGAFQLASRRIVPLQDCLLQHPRSVQALIWLSGQNLKGLSYLVTRVNRAGQLMVILCGALPHSPVSAFPDCDSFYYCHLRPHPAHALDGVCQYIAGEKTLCERLSGLEFSISPQSFFQVNSLQAERLYAAALDALELTGSETVLDAYCGAGTITLAAARRCKRAVGVEIVRPAVLDAQENARRNGLENSAQFFLGDAATQVPKLISEGMRFDAALLDPPRKGADERVLRAILHADAPRISYVSCDPATLARDLKFLCASGYRLAWAQPVDMFPFTGHVETVALLSKGEIDSKKSVWSSRWRIWMSGFQQGAPYE